MLVIFDMDGTLSDCSHRRHLVMGKKKYFDEFYELCHLDSPNVPIVNVYQSISGNGDRVFIWTGRPEYLREKTESWLLEQKIFHYELRMRPNDQMSVPDVELKEEWLKSLSHKPDLVFDDRKRVVDMWRKNGITCCQVAEGDF